MEAKRHNWFRYLPTIEEILPDSFYDVPQTRQKTALGPMLIFAGVAYVTAVIVFVLLMVDTSRSYVEETSIKSYDATGTDGYVCEMISKVSLSLTVDSPTDPTTAYSLVNVIESADQCVANLAAADPCNQEQTFLMGTVTALHLDDTYIAVGMFGSDQVFMVNSGGFFYKYNYTSGNISFSGADCVFAVYSPTMGITSNGGAYFLSRNVPFGYDCRCRNTTCVISSAQFQSQPIVHVYDTAYNGIINDNLYNLYIYDNTTLYSITYEPVFLQTSLLELDLSANITFRSVAVYTDPNSGVKSVFYVTSSNVLYMQRSGTTIVLDDSEYYMQALTTDGKLVYVSCTTPFDSRVQQINITNIHAQSSSYVANVDSTTVYYQSLAVRPDGGRLFMMTNDRSTQRTVGLYTYYPFSSDAVEALSFQSGFGVGWYTCIDQLVSPVPQSSALYASHCPNNGIVGQVLFSAVMQYVFTPTDTRAYALRTAPAYCSQLYSEICATVADLPPYSCTRKKYPTFFTVVGTAYANTTFLLSIMLVVFSMTLARVAKYYPPPGTNVHRPGTTDSELKGGSERQSDLDMAVTNPIE